MPTIQSSIIVWVLSILPATVHSYTGVAIACATLPIYAAYYYGPSNNFARIQVAIGAVEEILEHAKGHFERDQLALMDFENVLLQ